MCHVGLRLPFVEKTRSEVIVSFGDDRQLAVACDDDDGLGDAEDTPAGLANLYDNYLKRKL